MIGKISSFALFVFGVLICSSSCSSKSTREDNPITLYQEIFGSGIPSQTRPFEAKRTRLALGEYTTWIAFDCSEVEWEALSSSRRLTSADYSLRGVGPIQTFDDDTGFEGLLDDDFETLCEPGSMKIFFVRKLKTGRRVVYFHRQV